MLSFSETIKASGALDCTGKLRDWQLVSNLDFIPQNLFVGEAVDILIYYDQNKFNPGEQFDVSLRPACWNCADIHKTPIRIPPLGSPQPLRVRFDPGWDNRGGDISQRAYTIQVEMVDKRVKDGYCKTSDSVLITKVPPKPVTNAQCNIWLDANRYKKDGLNIRGSFSTIYFDPKGSYSPGAGYTLAIFEDSPDLARAISDNTIDTRIGRDALYRHITAAGRRNMDNGLWDNLPNRLQTLSIPTDIARNINGLPFGLTRYRLLGIGVGLNSNNTADLHVCDSVAFDVNSVGEPTLTPAPFSFTVQPNPAIQGGSINISWNNIPVPTAKDFYGLFPQGTTLENLNSGTLIPDFSDYLNCQQTAPPSTPPNGSCIKTIPSSMTARDYILYLFSNDRFIPITTGVPLRIVSPTPTPTYFPDQPTNTPIPTIALSPTSFPIPSGPLARGIFCTEGTNAGVETAIGCIPTKPQEFVAGLFKFGVSMGGGIALLLMAAGVFQMMTSAGNPEGIKKGSEQITNAVIGLLFIIFAVLLLQVIGVDILQIPGFGKS